jgi:hypothetical protein
MEYNPNRQSENKLKVAIAVLTILATALIFLYFRERQRNNRVEEISTLQAKELLQTNTQLDSIENQLNNKMIEIKRLGGDIDELVKAKIQLQADKIALQKMDGFSAKKYQSKIKEYVALLGEKDAQLYTLRKENGILVAKNDSLSKETKTLLEGISFAQKALSDSVPKKPKFAIVN